MTETPPVQAPEAFANPEASKDAAEDAASSPARAVVVSGLTRHFGSRLGIEALDFEIRRGEVLAVLGDNGAGKTTLLDIVAGADIADSGSVIVIDRNGARLAFEPGSRRAAIEAGIGMVGRRRMLAGGLTALQNIMLGQQSLWRLRLSRQSARKRIAELMQRMSMRFPLDAPVAGLGAGDWLRIDVMRALYSGAETLLLDEPTTDLTEQEGEALFQGLRNLAADGLAVAFTTHKISEAFEYADRILVMRDGCKIADLPTAGQDRSAFATMMTGRAVTRPQLTFRAAGDALLEFRKVDARGVDERASLMHVSFELRGGEVLGIAGIAGNGQDTLAEIVCGLARPASGHVLLYGRQLRRYDAGAFVRAGVGRIPPNCPRTAIVPELTIEENIAVEEFQSDWFQKFGLLRRAEIGANAREIIKTYELDHPSPTDPSVDLPASAIQKLVLARVFESTPQLLLACDPTRGLDAVSAETVHRQLMEARDDGAGILLVSADVDELLMLADSIAVLHQGRLTLPQPTGAFDTGSLGHMMGGHGSLALDWTGWGE